MQHKRLAVALLASFPLFASAQSNVTLYGMVDAAIALEDNGVNDRTTVVNSGNQSASRIGFRGTEQLGGGLKALFNLEAGTAIDTGAGDSALFGRRAVVGLEGAFGTVTVGREYSPIAAVAGASDTLGQGFYGSNLSSFNAGRLTRRLSSSVNYKSQSLSGFKFLAAYAAGEKNSGPSGDLQGVGLEYANGPIYVGAAYHKIERLATGDDKEYSVGAAFKAGNDLEFKGNYMVADQTGANNKFTQANVGVSKGFGPHKVFFNLQRNEIDGGAEGDAFTVAYSYALSKRTNVYSTYAQMRNNGRGLFGLNASSTQLNPPAGAFGADPSVFNVGIRHSF